MRSQFLEKDPAQGILNLTAMLATIIMLCLMVMTSSALAQTVVNNGTGIRVVGIAQQQHVATAEVFGLPTVLPVNAVVIRGAEVAGDSKFLTTGTLATAGCVTNCASSSHTTTYQASQVMKTTAGVTGLGNGSGPVRVEGTLHGRTVVDVQLIPYTPPPVAPLPN